MRPSLARKTELGVDRATGRVGLPPRASTRLAIGAGAGLVMAASAGFAARQALRRMPHIPFIS